MVQEATVFLGGRGLWDCSFLGRWEVRVRQAQKPMFAENQGGVGFIAGREVMVFYSGHPKSCLPQCLSFPRKPSVPVALEGAA